MIDRAKKRALVFMLIAWMLPALACNFPYIKNGSSPNARQETLMATLFPPIPTADPLAGTPVPANTLAAEPSREPPTEVPAQTGPVIQYSAQPGDTLSALALRFGVEANQITSTQPIPPQTYIPAGQQLSIPQTLPALGPARQLMPDSEIVYSPAQVDFNIQGFIQQSGGFLSGYSEEVDKQTLTGAQIVSRVALEISINPRLLLAILDYRSHWVRGQPADPSRLDQPIGFGVPEYRGLYKELVLVGRQLTIGYYGWRDGDTVSLRFSDGSTLRLNPALNAGTVSLEYLFSVLYNRQNWQSALFGSDSFLNFYQAMVGDAWTRSAAMGPLLPDALAQPVLELPFNPGEAWSFTGGPHMAWGVGSTRGGIDFAPVKNAKGCTVSDSWVTASAPGLVVRSENGVVITDLDMDGHEQTGWSLMYLHIASQDRVPLGTRVATSQKIGHPSCEGGVATGTHVHLARKYNGEWIYAGYPVPFVVGGWQANPGAQAYLGDLVKGDQVVTARPDGSHGSLIYR